MAKEIDKLLKELERQGFTYKLTRKQHYAVYGPEGHLVTVLSGTPSDRRSLKNGLAQLRAAGFRRQV
ncbi:hypothetical protein [Lentzea sp. NPDC092896]|uniref:hypothetical protein n=1 Tax=Lentzea sp. NPDC092896 TaxID=3364127 RepID=UPI003812AF5E